jgi:hypothetical protein
MNNIFGRIYQLLRSGQRGQQEDFFTEIFAEIINNSESALSFLKEFANHKFDDIQRLEVVTQKTYIALPGHVVDNKPCNSRPDMVIEFQSNDNRHLIFIENKIDSVEGTDQLSRYADHLKINLDNGKQVALLYITKNYESKEDITEKCEVDGIPFIPLRWYQVYQWLKQRDDEFIGRVLNYMEVLKMDQSRRFAPIDLVVMQETKRILSMMDECLSGQVQEIFTSLYGKPAQLFSRLTELRDNNYYNMYKSRDSNEKSISCGFVMLDNEYPFIEVTYGIRPSYHNFDNELALMDEFVFKHDGWVKVGSEDAKDWADWQGVAGVYCRKSLAEFLHYDDHVLAIEEFFVKKLNELKGLASNF